MTVNWKPVLREAIEIIDIPNFTNEKIAEVIRENNLVSEEYIESLQAGLISSVTSRMADYRGELNVEAVDKDSRRLVYEKKPLQRELDHARGARGVEKINEQLRKRIVDNHCMRHPKVHSISPDSPVAEEREGVYTSLEHDPEPDTSTVSDDADATISLKGDVVIQIIDEREIAVLYGNLTIDTVSELQSFLSAYFDGEMIALFNHPDFNGQTVFKKSDSEGGG